MWDRVAFRWLYAFFRFGWPLPAIEHQLFESSRTRRHRCLMAGGGLGLTLRRRSSRSGDIVVPISEVIVVEQILIRNLPAGTKAALRKRAKRSHRSVEAEARDALTKALSDEPVTIVDLLGTDEGADVEFEPERLGLSARSAQL